MVTSRLSLTPRERQVLDLLWSGLSLDEAGARLGITERTARNHVRSIFGRLGVGTRMDAFRAAGYIADAVAGASASDGPPLHAHEAAEALSVHVNTLKRIPPSDLPYFRLGSRGDRRYRRQDVTAYIARRLVG